MSPGSRAGEHACRVVVLCGSFVVVKTPTTPEGSILRRARLRAYPPVSVKVAAEQVGMSAEQYGVIERGYTRSRDGQPPRQFRAPAATVARIAANLSLTGQELAELEEVYPDAARALTLMRSASAGQSDGDADTEAVMKALISRYEGSERDFLEWLWYRQLDDDGRLKPQHERVQLVLGFVNRDRSEGDTEQAGLPAPR